MKKTKKNISHGAFQKLLDGWEEQVVKPDDAKPIQKWQLEELRRQRPHLFAEKKNSEGVKNESDWCESYKQLAARMTFHYQNADGSSKLKHEITPMTISFWRAGKNLGKKPLPPSSTGEYRMKVSLRAWIEWFDKYFFEEWKIENENEAIKNTTHEMISLHALREQNERAKIEFQQFEREAERGKYILVEVAKRIGFGMARELAAFWRERNESSALNEFSIKTKELGLSEPLEFALKQWLADCLKKFTDEVEARAENAARKFGVELEKKLNER